WRDPVPAIRELGRIHQEENLLAANTRSPERSATSLRAKTHRHRRERADLAGKHLHDPPDSEPRAPFPSTPLQPGAVRLAAGEIFVHVDPRHGRAAFIGGRPSRPRSLE